MAKIKGTERSETLEGTRFSDEILSYGGNDTIIATRGNDTLNGGSGTDTVNYGHLDQSITLERAGIINKGDLGTDQIWGIETIIGNSRKINTIDGSTGTSGQTSFSVRLDKESLTVRNVPNLGNLNFKVRNFNNVVGTSLADSIYGNFKNNEIHGRQGNDYLNGLNGDDTLTGGRGNDTLGGGRGNDRLYGGYNDDYLHGSYGNDTLIGGRGNDTLNGGRGSDVLEGNSGADDFVFGGFSSKVDVIKDFDFKEGDKVVIGFSSDISRFSDNEKTGEIFFDGVAFARVTPNQSHNFFTPQSDIEFM